MFQVNLFYYSLEPGYSRELGRLDRRAFVIKSPLFDQNASEFKEDNCQKSSIVTFSGHDTYRDHKETTRHFDEAKRSSTSVDPIPYSNISRFFESKGLFFEALAAPGRCAPLKSCFKEHRVYQECNQVYQTKARAIRIELDRRSCLKGGFGGYFSIKNPSPKRVLFVKFHEMNSRLVTEFAWPIKSELIPQLETEESLVAIADMAQYSCVAQDIALGTYLDGSDGMIEQWDIQPERKSFIILAQQPVVAQCWYIAFIAYFCTFFATLDAQIVPIEGFDDFNSLESQFRLKSNSCVKMSTKRQNVKKPKQRLRFSLKTQFDITPPPEDEEYKTDFELVNTMFVGIPNLALESIYRWNRILSVLDPNDLEVVKLKSSILQKSKYREKLNVRFT